MADEPAEEPTDPAASASRRTRTSADRWPTDASTRPRPGIKGRATVALVVIGAAAAAIGLIAVVELILMLNGG